MQGVDAVVEMNKEILWAYGPVTCGLHRWMDSVDHRSEKQVDGNCLTIATKEHHIELLYHPMLRRLWKRNGSIRAQCLCN